MICNTETILSENDVLITKQDEVCEIFNNYFVNVAKNIGVIVQRLIMLTSVLFTLKITTLIWH